MTKSLSTEDYYELQNGFSSATAQKLQLGTELEERSGKVAKAKYDFSVDAGAIGDITIQAAALPKNAVVTRVYSDEQTTLTSGGSATLQLKAGSTSLTDALAFDTAFTGVDSHPLASSAEAIKLSSASALVLTIATAALTAGKVVFAVEYWQTDA